MTVYVDDADILAEVRNGSRVHVSRWSHLTADTQEELHEFAARLGLRREWFQPGRPTGGRPSPFWHYDLTSGKRAQALAMAAVSMPSRELARYCRTRAGQLTPRIDHEGARAEDAIARRPRTVPENPCPDCGTAELTYSRRVCQARGLLRILATRGTPPSPGAAASPQAEAGK
jgi:hypothetical protein